MPEVSIALPTIQLPSLIRFRKNAAMHTESGSAPYVSGARVGEFGLRRPSPPESAPAPPEAGPAPVPPSCVPACPGNYQHQYLPPCGEGCTSQLMNDRSADPWKNSMEHQVAVREEQVAKLESQVTELQKLVEKLATEKVEAANAQPASAPNQRPRSQAINPWNQNSAPVQSAEVEARDEQALSRLEALLFSARLYYL